MKHTPFPVVTLHIQHTQNESEVMVARIKATSSTPFRDDMVEDFFYHNAKFTAENE